MISNLDYENFNKIFNSISLSFKNNDIKTVMNVMIVHIEHLIHRDVENYAKNNEVDITDILKDTKFNFDINFLLNLTEVYNKSLHSNYIRAKFFDIFNDVNIIKQLELSVKNIIYYWIDYIAVINNMIFEKLLKNN